MTILYKLTSGLSVALPVSMLIGCASTGTERATAAATSMRDIRSQLEATSASLDATVAALSGMIEKPAADLTAQYDKFSSAVAKLTSDAKSIQSAADAMRARGEEYFAGWEKELATVENPELQENSAARRAKLQEEYQTVTGSYEKAKAAFDPLLTSLKDVQGVLGLDLTSEGLKNAAAPCKRAKADAETVKKELAAAGKALDELATTLSGSGAS